MSNGLAISGVTAVLQYYLHHLYTAPPFTAGAVKVSSLAPDLIQQAFGNNPTEAENQVNLFLHQVTHNQSWRNVGLPSLAADGQTRLTNPPLALDLHYLLTVYATEYWEAEALLGFALMMLHENPVLARGEITNALTGLGLPYPHNPLTTPLASCGLADQVEMIKITPETLGREEMAWLWTALKADYRPTYPFQASVVLMQPQQQTTLATPVLRRRVRAQPIQPAVILQVSPPNHQIAAAPTDTVTVTGENLSGVAQVLLSNSRYPPPYTAPVTSSSATEFTFVPNQPVAGVYDLAAQFKDSSGAITQTTNTLPIALAPVLPTQLAHVTGGSVTVSFTPDAVEGQSVSLVLGSSAAPALPFTGSVGSLTFAFQTPLPNSPALARLVVDGVTSQMQVNWHAHPPVFTGPMVTL
jgi:hypothetical protein